MMKYATLTFALFLILAQSVTAQTNKLEGDWEGYINLNGRHLVVITHFQKQQDGYTGTLDIPQQGAKGLVLQNIKVTANDSVYFQQNLIGVRLEGYFKTDSTIVGRFHQHGVTFPFKLKRVVSANREIIYHHQAIIIKNDSIKIGGTLSWPKGQKTEQLVIIISGSGAQNRDGATPVTDFEPYAELAYQLTNRGIAVFRYDDRGVGKSTGSLEKSTIQQLADDVQTIVNFFSNNNHDVPAFTDIILLGHSMGGIIAGKVATDSQNIDALILMASTGLTMKQILHYQVKQAYQRAGVAESLIKKEIAARENLMKAILHGEDIDKAQQAYQKIFAKVKLAKEKDSTRAQYMAKIQAQSLTSIFSSPLMKSLLLYHPTDDLKDLGIPVLVLFGGKDTQAPIKYHKKPIKKALKKAGVSYQIKIFSNANHLFQKAKTGKIQEYATLKNKFVGGFIETIAEWIDKN